MSKDLESGIATYTLRSFKKKGLKLVADECLVIMEFEAVEYHDHVSYALSFSNLYKKIALHNTAPFIGPNSRMQMDINESFLYKIDNIIRTAKVARVYLEEDMLLDTLDTLSQDGESSTATIQWQKHSVESVCVCVITSCFSLFRVSYSEKENFLDYINNLITALGSIKRTIATGKW